MPDNKSYIDISEMVALTGLSRATIWRLKEQGKIQFFQPAGKGGRVMFPKDAIEMACLNETPRSRGDSNENAESEPLPGPLPKWMSPSKYKK